MTQISNYLDILASCKSQILQMQNVDALFLFLSYFLTAYRKAK